MYSCMARLFEPFGLHVYVQMEETIDLKSGLSRHKNDRVFIISQCIFYLLLVLLNMFYNEWNACWWYVKLSYMHLSVV
jgi:hypothetical protein